MNVQQQIDAYLDSQPQPKRNDLLALHELVLGLHPTAELWFLDGKDGSGKIVSNPNIGYGRYNIRYADGKTKPFYQVGISANTSGISVYIMGIDDKDYLAKTYAYKIGKAKVTGYCIKSKAVKDINLGVLALAIAYGLGLRNSDTA